MENHTFGTDSKYDLKDRSNQIQFYWHQFFKRLATKGMNYFTILGEMKVNIQRTF